MLKNFFGWFRKSTNTEHEVISDDDDSDEFSDEDDSMTILNEGGSSTSRQGEIPKNDQENVAQDEDDVEIQVMIEEEILPPNDIDETGDDDDNDEVSARSSKAEEVEEDEMGPSGGAGKSLNKHSEVESLTTSPNINRVVRIVEEELTEEEDLSEDRLLMDDSEITAENAGSSTESNGNVRNEDMEASAHGEERRNEEEDRNEEFEMAMETTDRIEEESSKANDNLQSTQENHTGQLDEAEMNSDRVPGMGTMTEVNVSTDDIDSEEIILVSVTTGTYTGEDGIPDSAASSSLSNLSNLVSIKTEKVEEELMEAHASTSIGDKHQKNTHVVKTRQGSKKLRSSRQHSNEKEREMEKVESDNESDDEDTSAPGVPCERTATSSSITITWEPPKKGYDKIEYYEVKYREQGRKRKRWASRFTEERKETFTVADLIGDTNFEFKVRAILAGGEEGPFSETSDVMHTRFSLAKQIASQHETIRISQGPPIVYKIPVRELLGARNRVAMTRKCTFGPPDPTAREKTIMMVGATGAGKSTLIDGMINYITDVSWEDEFRFSIIDLMEEEKKKKGNEANSQTEWISCYTVNHRAGSPVDYTLNIIDTPGFGDTRGLQRDKKIVDQIRGFFATRGENGVTSIDAVCFVTQAPLARLTPPQRYIFDAILSVFGADIASNIFVLITFADGHDPPVKAALEEAKVPFAKAFKFNNSALFSSTADNDEIVFGKMFWSMGKESFKKFFDELGKVEQKSLWMTSKVLELRQRLEVTIQGLQPQIEDGLNKLNTIRQEQEVLRRHKAEIEANKNFTYEVEEIHTYQEPTEPGTYITNCLKCNRTCHYPCRIPDDDGKKGCLSIDPSRLVCVVCPQHCHWSMHKNNDFRYVTYTMKIEKTYEQLKEKYHIAQDQEKKTRTVLAKVKESFREMGKQVTQMVSEVRRCINQLNEIALRPNPLTDLDYIDILIENEKNEKKYGWEVRVELYQKARKEAELLKRAGEQNFSPWEDVDDILENE